MKVILILLFFFVFQIVNGKFAVMKDVDGFAQLRNIHTGKNDSITKIDTVETAIDQTIIDPIEISCYQLSSDKKLKSFKGGNEYIGRVVLNAKIDTTNLTFYDFTIVFAKLHDKKNPNDSIEIRLNEKWGNYQYIEDLKPRLIKHLKYIKILRINSNNCTKPTNYFLPIKME